MSEWSTAVKVALCLILVAAISFILYSIFYIAQNRAETESENVSGIISTISESEFVRFKNREVTGEEIIAFVQQVKDKDVMVLVNTKPLHKKYGDEIAIFGVLSKAYAEEIDNGLKYPVVYDDTNSETDRGWSNSLTKYESHDGYIIQLKRDANGLYYNRDYSPLLKENSAVYIGNDIKFKSSLIYWSSGEILGVYFTEV